MNEVNDISLEEAAKQYDTDNFGKPMPGKKVVMEEVKTSEWITDAFKAGAQWQKEQDKEILYLARQIIVGYNLRHPHEPQLLAGYTNEAAIEKINNYVLP